MPTGDTTLKKMRLELYLQAFFGLRWCGKELYFFYSIYSASQPNIFSVQLTVVNGNN